MSKKQIGILMAWVIIGSLAIAGDDLVATGGSDKNPGTIQETAAGRLPSLTLHPIFDHHLVLQQNKTTIFSGRCKPGETISIAFGSLQGTTRATDEGHWFLPLKIGKSSNQGKTLTVQGGEELIRLKNVVVGDVYLFARQAHVETTLMDDEPIEGSKDLRFMSIHAQASTNTLRVIDKSLVKAWSNTESAPIGNMFGASFCLGMELLRELKCPIGIIDLHMGSKATQSWAKGSECYNGTIAPLKGLGLAGVILQTGNDYPYAPFFRFSRDPSGRSGSLTPLVPTPPVRWSTVHRYKKNSLFGKDPFIPLLTHQWREAIGDPQLPFGMVLTPGKPQFQLGEINKGRRMVQLEAIEATHHCEAIFPGVGRRMFSNQVKDENLLVQHALHWALSLHPGYQGPVSGPKILGFEKGKERTIINFQEGTANGLSTLDGESPKGFELAGEDGVFHPAQAKIEGSHVVAWSDAVSNVQFLRYDFSREPYQCLVNREGLRGIPWSSSEAEPIPFLKAPEEDTPEFYTLPASDWSRNESTLSLLDGKMREGVYLLGPTGIGGDALGKNIYVSWVQKGSPADGKVHKGDFIYAVNGQRFDHAPRQVQGGPRRDPLMFFADAITQSESASGTLTLGIRRGNQNVETDLHLEVKGNYSETSPYDCPKTQRIIQDTLDTMTGHGNPMNNAYGGLLQTDALFLLGTRDPDYLHFVMRTVYAECQKTENAFEEEKKQMAYIYTLSYRGILLAEYFLATGDAYVLPSLKKIVDALVSVQRPDGLWGKNFIFESYPTAGGYMMQSSLSSFIALILARESGVEVDAKALALAVDAHRAGRGEYAQYGYGAATFKEPWPEDPLRDVLGLRSSINGKVALGAIAYDLLGDKQTASTCAQHTLHCFNTLNGGYEGNCWNVAWSPLGARVAGRKAFITFMEKSRWYRELFRRHDGAMECQINPPWIGDHNRGVNGFYALSLLVPREGLRILGAPPSPFGIQAAASLSDGVRRHQAGDFDGSDAVVEKLLKTHDDKDLVATGTQLLKMTTYVKRGVKKNLSLLREMLDSSNMQDLKALYEKDRLHLERWLGPDDEDLKFIHQALAQPTVQELEPSPFIQRPARSIARPPKPSEPESITPLINMVSSPRVTGKATIYELLSDVPSDCVRPEFDDRAWPTVKLPTTWCPDHVAVIRTTFIAKDTNQIKKLRATINCRNIFSLDVYLNGVQILYTFNLFYDGKGKKEYTLDLKPETLNLLKEGNNTLVFKAQHFSRWAYYPRKSIPFSFNLDAHL